MGQDAHDILSFMKAKSAPGQARVSGLWASFLLTTPYTMSCTALGPRPLPYAYKHTLTEASWKFHTSECKKRSLHTIPPFVQAYLVLLPAYTHPGTTYIPILWKFRRFLSTAWKLEICLSHIRFNVQSRSSLNTQRSGVKTSWTIPSAVLKSNFLFPQVGQSFPCSWANELGTLFPSLLTSPLAGV